MTTRIVLSIAIVFSSVLALGDEPTVSVPKTPDPTIRRVQANADGTLTVFVTETFPVIETRVTTVPANQTRLLKEQFKTPKPAIVSTFENSVVDPSYLSVLKDEVAIVVLNQQLPIADDSMPPDVPAPPRSSISVAASQPMALRAVADVKVPCLTNELFDSRLQLIEDKKDDPKLRKEALVECSRIVQNDPDRCTPFAKVLVKVLSEKDGDLELRKSAIEVGEEPKTDSFTRPWDKLFTACQTE